VLGLLSKKTFAVLTDYEDLKLTNLHAAMPNKGKKDKVKRDWRSVHELLAYKHT